MAVAATQTAEREAVASPAIPRALPIALVAVGLGLLAQLLFFDVGIGINFPIAILAALLAAWFAAPTFPRLARPRDAWLPVAALTFASFVAVRGDRTLVGLDMLGSLALAAASVASLGGLAIVARPAGALLVLALRLFAAAFGGAVAVLASARRALPEGGLRRGLGPWAAVLRGLLIAVPLVLLFVALFSAADAVFADYAGRLFEWDLGLDAVIGRTVVALVVAWIATGALSFAARPGDDAAEREAMTAWSRRPRLGTVEVVTVLVALNVVFLAFVILQAAYLFGGQDTLAATGLTYAEYARQGFFQLLAAAFVVGALVLAAESFVRDRTLLYRAAIIGLVLMTVVVLASAFLRLRLYQDAYGWTELRFYVLAAIIWLAIGAVMAVGTILANRSGWLLHGMLALSMLFGLAFNLIGPVRFVAEQNVGRFIGPEALPQEDRAPLDVLYLSGLGSDAVAPVLHFLDSRSLPGGFVSRTLNEMVRTSGLDDEGNSAWQAWNFSREQARELLGR